MMLELDKREAMNRNHVVAVVLLLAGCGGALVSPSADAGEDAPSLPPECTLPAACVDVPRCELGDNTAWLMVAVGGYIHQQELRGTGINGVSIGVVSTLCAIDAEGRRIDR